MEYKSVRSQKLAIIGAGGHGRVVSDILRLQPNIEVVGFLDDDATKFGQVIDSIPVIGRTPAARTLKRKGEVVGVVLAVGHNGVRSRLFERMVKWNISVNSAIHPQAVIASTVNAADGLVVMAGVVINPGCQIGRDVCVNTGATIDHDTVLEDHSHIFPGACLNGGVRIGRYSYVCSGAIIAPYVTIGDNATVAAGTVVLKDVPSDVLVAGVPARVIRSKDAQALGALR